MGYTKRDFLNYLEYIFGKLNKNSEHEVNRILAIHFKNINDSKFLAMLYDFTSELEDQFNKK